MTKILFICHGNICRSPMAEMVMKDMVAKLGIDSEFEIASAATSTEEIGNPVYPPARSELAKHGIKCERRGARQIIKRDYADYDLLIGMDSANIRNMNRMLGWAWVAEDLSRADLEAQASMYDDLTCEDLLDAAQAVFRPENLVISIQRDPAQTPKNLKPLLRELRQLLA